MFVVGKSTKGRFVFSPGRDGKTGVRRYYPQKSNADFNAAILAELGKPLGADMADVMACFSVTEDGWREDHPAKDSQEPSPK